MSWDRRSCAATAAVASWLIDHMGLKTSEQETGDLLLTCLSPSFTASRFPSYRARGWKKRGQSEGASERVIEPVAEWVLWLRWTSSLVQTLKSLRPSLEFRMMWSFLRWKCVVYYFMLCIFHFYYFWWICRKTNKCKKPDEEFGRKKKTTRTGQPVSKQLSSALITTWRWLTENAVISSKYSHNTNKHLSSTFSTGDHNNPKQSPMS